MPTLQLGVLVSGTGTNLQAIFDAISQGELDAQVRLVLSNRAGVGALERARREGVPTRVISHRDFSDRESFDQALVDALHEADARWIVLAGFMRVLTTKFLGAFADRVVNIHPALLPSFPGVDAQEQALRYGVRIAGCTVHFVDAGTDTGPILAQAAVPVLPDDTRDALAARILAREHELLITALRWISEGRVSVLPASPGERRRVVVDGKNAYVGVSEDR